MDELDRETRVVVSRSEGETPYCRVSAYGSPSDETWIGSHEEFFKGVGAGEVARILVDLKDCRTHPSVLAFVDFFGRARFKHLAGVRIALYAVGQRDGFAKMDVVTRISREARIDFAIEAFEDEADALAWLGV